MIWDLILSVASVGLEVGKVAYCNNHVSLFHDHEIQIVFSWIYVNFLNEALYYIGMPHFILYFEDTTFFFFNTLKFYDNPVSCKSIGVIFLTVLTAGLCHILAVLLNVQ